MEKVAMLDAKMIVKNFSESQNNESDGKLIELLWALSCRGMRKSRALREEIPKARSGVVERLCNSASSARGT